MAILSNILALLLVILLCWGGMVWLGNRFHDRRSANQRDANQRDSVDEPRSKPQDTGPAEAPAVERAPDKTRPRSIPLSKPTPCPRCSGSGASRNGGRIQPCEACEGTGVTQ